MVLHTLDIEFEAIQHIGDVFNFDHLGKFSKSFHKFLVINLTFISILNFSLVFRCLARVRAKTDGSYEIVETQHNHDILTERRKKGSLKAMYDLKRKQQQLKAARNA